jgi:hypothetical protein
MIGRMIAPPAQMILLADQSPNFYVFKRPLTLLLSIYGLCVAAATYFALTCSQRLTAVPASRKWEPLLPFTKNQSPRQPIYFLPLNY